MLLIFYFSLLCYYISTHFLNLQIKISFEIFNTITVILILDIKRTLLPLKLSLTSSGEILFGGIGIKINSNFNQLIYLPPGKFCFPRFSSVTTTKTSPNYYCHCIISPTSLLLFAFECFSESLLIIGLN